MATVGELTWPLTPVPVDDGKDVRGITRTDDAPRPGSWPGQDRVDVKFVRYRYNDSEPPQTSGRDDASNRHASPPPSQRTGTSTKARVVLTAAALVEDVADRFRTRAAAALWRSGRRFV